MAETGFAETGVAVGNVLIVGSTIFFVTEGTSASTVTTSATLPSKEEVKSFTGSGGFAHATHGASKANPSTNISVYFISIRKNLSLERYRMEPNGIARSHRD